MSGKHQSSRRQGTVNTLKYCLTRVSKVNVWAMSSLLLC